MSGADALHAHLAGGIATVARCWSVTRKDGQVQGFTDHDRDLEFEGIFFRADSGLTARALSQSTGLAVDNTEALGALSSDALREEDILAGRYDGAEVVAWLVNWNDPARRKIVFRGHIGEIRRNDGAFHAEMRGLTEALNAPVGRRYQKPCDAVLGDTACGFDLAAAGYVHETALAGIEGTHKYLCSGMEDFAPGWFQRGRLWFETGAAKGIFAVIKSDTQRSDGLRCLELWEPLRVSVAPNDAVRVEAGCDKRFETCRLKFNNALNFRGFPDLPDEDWIQVHPAKATRRSGGSRR